MKNAVSQKGFTLVELIVTIAVLCIVLSMATVSFKGAIWRNQVNTAATDLVSAMGFARSEAITRAMVVTACRSTNVSTANNSSTPVPSCSTGSNGWETGFIVFADSDGDGVRDSGEELLRVFNAREGQLTMAGDSGNNVENFVRYAATGFLAADGDDAGTIVVKNEEKTNHVVLSKNGRTVSEVP